MFYFWRRRRSALHAVITGGSRGIGAAAVRAFARKGYAVSFLYEKDHAAARKIAAETGAKAYACDVADESRVQEVFSQLKDVDVLVNNAGICHTGLISQISPDQWRRIFQVNVDGAFYCTRAVLPQMLNKQAGAIVNVSSMWGEVGASCEAAYSATKGALIALTKALSKELGPSNIRVNAVAPGVIMTDMCKDISPDILEELKEETPLCRLGRPEDVAEAIVYLAEAEFVTGQILGVNGGFVV